MKQDLLIISLYCFLFVAQNELYICEITCYTFLEGKGV